MSLHSLAQTLSARGRDGDSTLVHMTPGEVNSLQALALAGGGSLTVNPDTGLPEANFLKKMLPMIAGGALSMIPGVGPLMAAGIVGGGTAIASRDLGKGLMAGLGAFGGAGIGNALSGLGTTAMADTAAQALAANPAAATGDVLRAANTAADTAGGLRAALPGVAGSASGFQKMQAGLGAAMQNPQSLVSGLGGNKEALRMAGMAAAPVVMAQPEMQQQDPNANPHPMMSPVSYGYDRPSSSLEDLTRPRRYADGGLAALQQNPYYTMSGDSAEAYQYLMGMRPSSKSAQEMRLIAEQPRPTTVTGAKYEGLPQYQLDMRTREMTRVDKPEDEAAAASAPRGYSAGLMDMDQGAPGMAKGGRLLSGPGDGVSDSIPAHIDGKTPARLATGEFVFDARTVSEIGNGDTRAGAKKLYAVMNAIHKHRANADRGKPSGADKELRALMT